MVVDKVVAAYEEDKKKYKVVKTKSNRYFRFEYWYDLYNVYTIKLVPTRYKGDYQLYYKRYEHGKSRKRHCLVKEELTKEQVFELQLLHT